MKKAFTILALAISVVAFADMSEKGRGPRPEPTAEEKACREEIRGLGCGSPRENRDAFRSCIESKASQLSEACQAVHQKMKERRPPQRPNSEE